MKSIIAIAIVALMLGGCSTNGPVNRAYKNVSQAQADRDTISCRNEAGTNGGGFFVFGPAIVVLPVIAAVGAYKQSKTENYYACLERRGYTVERKKFGPMSCSDSETWDYGVMECV